MNISRNAVSIRLLLFLIVINTMAIIAERTSGIYMNNEQEQTILERYLTFDEKIATRRRILRLLGIPEKPKDQEKQSLIKRSAPQFMLNVYTNEVHKKEWKNDGEYKLNEHNIYAISNSDVIISFMAQQPHQGLKGKPDKVRRMWFDVSAVPVDDGIVMSAELRLFREHIVEKQGNGTFLVKVYRVLRDIEGNKNLHFVDSVKTTGRGWMMLNVSESLDFWMKNPKENRGFYLSVEPMGSTTYRKVRPEKIGIVGFKSDNERQPFMVGFYKNSIKKNIQLRLNDIPAKLPRNMRASSFGGLYNHYTSSAQTSPSHRKTCNLRTLYVNFKDIRWEDWIIAPSGFNAFYCGGDCDYPLANRMDATNHAIVQSLVHLKYPDRIPKPRCAPMKHSSLSVLYFQDQNNVVLKKFRQMIVQQCSCQ